MMVATLTRLVVLVLLLPLPVFGGPRTLRALWWSALPGATTITFSVESVPLVRSSLTPSRLVVDLWPVAAGIPYGGFFARSTGHPLGLVVIDGRVLSTPWGRRSVFAIREDRTPAIGTFVFRGRVRTPHGIVPISAVNRPPRPGGLALYTPEYGPRTPPDALHAVVRGGRVVTVSAGRVEIPPDGYVLTASPGQVKLIQGTMRRSDPVEVKTSIHPGGIRHALGAGPRLVQGGRLHIPYAWEGFRPSLYRVRTSRSAVGITGAGKVLLVAVEVCSRDATARTPG